ncbi:MAG: carbohydrate kinase family protein [Lachnospiraceae bacterium]|nr:carbohydrate kinase family protein [Lachnospiraceae bacterium]
MNVVCMGEMMVDIIVRTVNEVSFDNGTSRVEEISVKNGGDATNNAIDLSKLGNHVRFIALAGCDALSDLAVRTMEQYGVDMSEVAYSPDLNLARSLILVNGAGDRHFLQYTGTSDRFCLGDINMDVLDWADLVQIGGTYHLPSFDGVGAAELLKKAKERGVITSMDVTSCRDGRWEVIETCFPFLDYFLPSVEQAREIAGQADPEKIADYFLKRGVKNVVVKLGEKGSYFSDGTTSFYCDCYRVPVAETTGAGDAFVAGFLTGVGKHMKPEDCVRLGTACSAFVIQSVGATDGLKDYDTVRRFMEEAGELKVTFI